MVPSNQNTLFLRSTQFCPARVWPSAVENNQTHGEKITER